MIPLAVPVPLTHSLLLYRDSGIIIELRYIMTPELPGLVSCPYKRTFRDIGRRVGFPPGRE